MNREILGILRCPRCGASLALTPPATGNDPIERGELECAGPERHRYPIVDSIPRFVPAKNYASNFGFQWNKFRLTQLDSHSGTQISRDRFFASTGWDAKEMKGKRVLDIGCGAGRFTEIALLSGAEVVALDYSAAVDACWENNRGKGVLHCLQGDIYHLPFVPGSFDYVYCLGVLQHTPDVEGAFRGLTSQPKQGGKLAVDVYPRLWQNIVSGKDWIRPVTRRVDRMRLFHLVENTLIPVLLPVSKLIGRIPLFGRKLRRVVPVSNYEGIFPLSSTQLREWAILDTYDMLAPTYDQPQTATTLRSWFQTSGFKEIEVFRAGHLIGRGLK
ncbi:MAG: methyltransferase domain-containing protein [Gemmatimonadota bacterium]|nr:methyltransferase domain-containing protein [Gemmatimonadota bacterium]